MTNDFRINLLVFGKKILSLEHSAILSTFIKLPYALKSFVLSIFEWPLKTGITVYIHRGN